MLQVLFLIFKLKFVAVNAEESKVRRNAAFALLLPGKVLHLSALIVTRKFRDRGNKAGALEAMKHLESCGLGKLSPWVKQCTWH